jgi:predicted nucleotidyltransferase component of viral defense system
MTAVESVAEKLARYARIPLARDLYDLCWYGRRGSLPEQLIRRTWVQKVFGDVVIDKRWDRSFEPADVLRPRPAHAIDEETIGFLIHPTDVAKWEREFRTRYAFLADLDADDLRWSDCDPRDKYQFTSLGVTGHS